MSASHVFQKSISMMNSMEYIMKTDIRRAKKGWYRGIYQS